jgi:hypothetical protein
MSSCASSIDPVSGARVLPWASSESHTYSHDFSSSGGRWRRGGEGGEVVMVSLRCRLWMFDFVAVGGIDFEKQTMENIGGFIEKFELVCGYSSFFNN